MPRKLNSGTDTLLRRPDHRQIEKTKALSKWLFNITNVIGPKATCIAMTWLGTINLTMKKLQNDSIAVDRQLVKNDRSEHELLSLMPDVTNVEVNSIVTDVTSASVILTLTNIAIISGNSHTDVISNVVSNTINVDHTDANLTVTEISGSVVTSAQDKITSIILSMHDWLKINITLRLSQSSLILEDIKKNYKNNLFYIKII